MFRLCCWFKLVHTYHTYCNSVLSWVNRNLLCRLQSILNDAAAWLLCSARKFDRITPLLHELHWLKVPERIQYQLCILVYWCLHNTALSYLSELLQLAADVDDRRCLHSASSMTLVTSDVPHCRILSPDKTEWWLISATLCGWRHCFMADSYGSWHAYKKKKKWLWSCPQHVVWRLATVPMAAVQAWYTLPLDVRAAPSLAAFQRRLKLSLFHASFSDDW